MRSARLTLALDTGALTLPAEGRIAVYRPRIGDDLGALPQDRVTVVTGFKPDHDHFAKGYSVTAAAPYAAALVCLPRAREAARALIAQAAAEVAPGGLVVVDGQKTDGIDTALKDLRSAGGAVGKPVEGAWQAGELCRRAGPFGLGGSPPPDRGRVSDPARRLFGGWAGPGVGAAGGGAAGQVWRQGCRSWGGLGLSWRGRSWRIRGSSGWIWWRPRRMRWLVRG